MKRGDALQRIKQVFGAYHQLTSRQDPWLRKLTRGKLYELYCLAKTVQKLHHNFGYVVTLHGRSIHFQASPGRINPGRPHFAISHPAGRPLFRLFTDVMFRSLGATSPHVTDRSARQEIDLVLVRDEVAGYPGYDEIILGVECKSHEHFTKNILKEALGIRRELCFCHPGELSRLGGLSPIRHQNTRETHANTQSEYWLAFLDPAGRNYAQSPQAFGIAFKNW